MALSDSLIKKDSIPQSETSVSPMLFSEAVFRNELLRVWIQRKARKAKSILQFHFAHGLVLLLDLQEQLQRDDFTWQEKIDLLTYINATSCL